MGGGELQPPSALGCYDPGLGVGLGLAGDSNILLGLGFDSANRQTPY
jgi:hypothetical protein